MDKLKFLSSVDTLSGAVHAQANGNMDDFFPKTVLAEKIMVSKALSFWASVLRGHE